MKVFLIVLLTVSAVTNDIDPNYTYKDFMRQYNRTYEGEEKSLHERIFNSGYAEILRLRDQGHDLVVN